jgi:hypothetical protein
MKRFITYAVISMFTLATFGQEANVKNEKSIEFSGYISNQIIFDTYDSFDAREGLTYLFPKPANLDANNKDLNAFPQLEMLSLSTRLRSKIIGSDAFGAKTSGLVEIDFLGTSEGFERLPRMRHAMIKMDWGTANLIMGQYWHPLLVVESFPQVISFAAGAPFQPINRSPQVRLTLVPNEHMQFSGTLWSQGYHASTGVTEIQRNSGLPGIHAQAKFNYGSLFFGGTAGYRLYKPNTVANTGNFSEQSLACYDVQVFAKASYEPFTFNAQFIYGSNLSSYIMLGSYGAAEPLATPDYEYKALKTWSMWAEVDYKFTDAIFFGLFGGYSANAGANGDYYSLDLGRGESIDYLFRISPRAIYKSGPMQFAFEYMGTGAVYGNTWDSNFKVTGSDNMVMNHRFMVEALYTF